jgi:hypothetical protein
MNREYDLFERMSDGSLMWRGFAKGLENARLRLQRIATETANECFAIDVSTGDIAARLNASGRREGGLKQ